MIGQVQFRDDDAGTDAGVGAFALNGAARAAGTSIRPPQVLEGDTAAELFRHGEAVFRVGKFVGVLFRRGGEDDSGELGVYCPTTRKLALFEPGTLVSVALEAGVGEP